MARGYNKAMLMGNLARDPDVRVTPSKQKVARFTLAVGRQWKDRSTGEFKEHTDFISCTAWGNTADLVERYLRKGRPCFVEGRVACRDYDDPKTGQHRWIVEINVEHLILLNSANRDGDSSQQPSNYQAQSYQQPAPMADMPGDMGSLRDEAGFDDEFPLDFSEKKYDDEGTGDVDIPF